MPVVAMRAAARRDLMDHYTYLTENAGQDIADRFLDRAETSISQLGLQPAVGAPVPTRLPELAGMRKWRVSDFDDFLIFYVAPAGAVSIVRILYATRDWWNLLELDPV